MIFPTFIPTVFAFFSFNNGLIDILSLFSDHHKNHLYFVRFEPHEIRIKKLKKKGPEFF